MILPENRRFYRCALSEIAIILPREKAVKSADRPVEHISIAENPRLD